MYYGSILIGDKTMINFIKKYVLQKWWVPILFFCIFAIFSLLLIASTNNLLYRIVDYSFLFFICLLLIAGIWQLISGKWYIGLLQLATLVIGIVGLGIIISLITFFGPDIDVFADNLELPKNVALNEPVDLEMRGNTELDSISKNESITFQLYNSFQPGLYEYDIWLNSKQKGTIYLKAFEITQEIQLSTSYLKERSSIQINQTNDLIKKFGTKTHFTIYEGDWGKPYGARFEIWFSPSNGNNDLKLLEKNYIIEGWMR